MKPLLIHAVIAAIFLAGCADVKTEVHASGTATMSEASAGEQTYAFERMPWQAASADDARYEALVRNQLAHYAFVEAPAPSARYLVSLAYGSRPATIDIDVGNCIEPCRSTGSTDQHGYRHTLTLRLFDRTRNRETYKVTVTSRDSHADPLHAIPYLAESVLAMLPYIDDRDWQVTLHQVDTGEDGNLTPDIISVEPLER